MWLRRRSTFSTLAVVYFAIHPPGLPRQHTWGVFSFCRMRINLPPPSMNTIIALATPPGEGAIGVIRLSGPDAITVADQAFYGKDLTQASGHTVHFGTLRTAAGEVLDEVLLTLFRGPRSYTGEDVVEISCHGSPYILQQVIARFVEEGVQLAKPGEFTMRAFLNGRMDLSQAEAVADLIASESEAAHRVAMQQMRGGFSDEIKALRQELIDFAALVELELDFGEEDVEFADRDDLKALILKIQRTLHQLMDSFRLGNVLKRGVPTSIAGRPNSGKSTLLNALLNEERAIVSDIPGTTRDTIEAALVIRGVQFRMVDTAGIRDTTDRIEAIGVERALQSVADAAVVIYLFDAARLSPTEVQQDLARLHREGLQLLVVANKIDLLDDAAHDDWQRHFPNLQLLSATERLHMDALRDTLYEIATGGLLQSEHTVVTSARHHDALRRADESLAMALANMSAGVTSDFVAMDIRQALYALGEVTGEVSVDDLLGSIFGRFCIGK